MPFTQDTRVRVPVSERLLHAPGRRGALVLRQPSMALVLEDGSCKYGGADSRGRGEASVGGGVSECGVIVEFEEAEAEVVPVVTRETDAKKQRRKRRRRSRSRRRRRRQQGKG